MTGAFGIQLSHILIINSLSALLEPDVRVLGAWLEVGLGAGQLSCKSFEFLKLFSRRARHHATSSCIHRLRGCPHIWWSLSLPCLWVQLVEGWLVWDQFVAEHHIIHLSLTLARFWINCLCGSSHVHCQVFVCQQVVVKFLYHDWGRTVISFVCLGGQLFILNGYPG